MCRIIAHGLAGLIPVPQDAVLGALEPHVTAQRRGALRGLIDAHGREGPETVETVRRDDGDVTLERGRCRWRFLGGRKYRHSVSGRRLGSRGWCVEARRGETHENDG